MPSSAPPGNRAAMEEALGPERTEALRDVCRVLGVRVDRWHRVPAVSRVWSTTATLLCAEELARQGRPWGDSVLEASEALDVNADTIASRARRWPRAAYS